MEFRRLLVRSLTGVALAIFCTAAGLPLGARADRANRRNMIMWAITIWSFFTALCGMAQNFWQLLFARIGVGIGEAGGTPPSHSILADYIKPSQRRSEEHTSELQSLMRNSYAVFCLKKKNKPTCLYQRTTTRPHRYISSSSKVR